MNLLRLRGKPTRVTHELEDFTKDHDDSFIAAKALRHFFEDMKKKMIDGERELKIPYHGRLRFKDKDGKIPK